MLQCDRDVRRALFLLPNQIDHPVADFKQLPLFCFDTDYKDGLLQKSIVRNKSIYNSRSFSLS